MVRRCVMGAWYLLIGGPGAGCSDCGARMWRPGSCAGCWECAACGRESRGVPWGDRAVGVPRRSGAPLAGNDRRGVPRRGASGAGSASRVRR